MNINQNPFREEILRLPNEENNENLNNCGFCWDSLALFIIGTATLYFLSRYGREILELLYDLGTNTLPEVTTRGFRGLMEFMLVFLESMF